MSAIICRSVASIAVLSALVLCRSSVADEIPWSTDIEASLERATQTGQPVLMEFTASWCGFCKKMEKTTFTDSDVAEQITRNFVPVRVDADKNKDLVKELGIRGLPAILVVSPELKVIERISGFQTPEALMPRLDAVIASHQGSQPTTQISRSRPAQNPAAGRPATRNPAPQEPMFPPPATSNVPSRAARQELAFEPIAQEEAPQVNRRMNEQPRQNSNFQPQSGAGNTATANAGVPDLDSFFKTISQETPAPGTRTESSKPAFGGICLVTAVEGRELVIGSDRNQIKYRGKTLYFSSAENKDRFLAAPATYWPMLDGTCAMNLIDNDEVVEGNLEFAAVFRKRIWLFSSSEAMQEFLRDPADISEEALERISESAR